MEIKGAVLAFVDVAPELTGDYNRWYDLDHLPTPHLAARGDRGTPLRRR